MSFKKDKYIIIRKAISKELASFLANYFVMKNQVYDTCIKARYMSPFERLLGYYENETLVIFFDFMKNFKLFFKANIIYIFQSIFFYI